MPYPIDSFKVIKAIWWPCKHHSSPFTTLDPTVGENICDNLYLDEFVVSQRERVWTLTSVLASIKGWYPSALKNIFLSFTGNTSEVNGAQSVYDEYSHSVSSILLLSVSVSCSPRKRSGGRGTKSHVILWSCILHFEAGNCTVCEAESKTGFSVTDIETTATKFWMSWTLSYHHKVIKIMTISLF